MSAALDLAHARRRSALERALGPAIADALARPDVVEAIVNADGRVWIDTVGEGLVETQIRLSADDREAAIRLLAREAGETVGEDRPVLATILPGSSARVQAVLPPLAQAPLLAIRKRAQRIFSLEQYQSDRIGSPTQITMLRHAVAAKRNIVVAGGTGSGKTTLLNALLAEPSFEAARVVILEDTAELQCRSPNCVQLLTKRSEPPVSMRALVQTTLRLRPDRIIVGEVRDGAALEVLKAWNTGHPGGLLTLHANSAPDALARLEDLAMEAAPAAPRRLIASAVDIVVFIARTAEGRRITEIVQVTGVEGETYRIQNMETNQC
ncbi:MAG: P-type conjugative transfer ATPase TrbB [Vitreimonas sp.]